MSNQLTLSKVAFVEVLDALTAVEFQRSDDAGMLGPVGPVIVGGDLVSLNPQPLPPQEFLVTHLPWGPHPDPRRSIAVTRAVINKSLSLYEMAGIIIVRGDVDRAVEYAGATLRRFVDDFCETPPHKGPFPAPWGPVLDAETLHPVNLVLAGAQCLKAADALNDHPLQGAISAAADRLLDTGLGRLADRQQQR